MKKLAGWMVVAMLSGVGAWVVADHDHDDRTTKKTALTVEKMVFCTSVEAREPKGEANAFRADVGKVYCWLLVTGAEGETTIKVGWWHGGNMMGEVPLTVRSPRFRTWASKTIGGGQTGEWTAKVTDGAGQVLKEASFTVGSSE